MVSASSKTWVTAANRHLAARTIEPLSAIPELPTIDPLPPDGLVSPSVQQDCASSYCSSHSFSMAIPRILNNSQPKYAVECFNAIELVVQIYQHSAQTIQINRMYRQWILV